MPVALPGAPAVFAFSLSSGGGRFLWRLQKSANRVLPEIGTGGRLFDTMSFLDSQKFFIMQPRAERWPSG